MRHKQISLTLWQGCAHAGRFLSCWRGVPVGCHLPAEARDGQMTASASLFQFEIRQVKLNCLWLKLICFDSFGTDHGSQLGGSSHQCCLSCPCRNSGIPMCPDPPWPQPHLESSDSTGILMVPVGSKTRGETWHRLKRVVV